MTFDIVKLVLYALQTSTTNQPEGLELSTANRDQEARLDIRASGFWRVGQEAFFDVRVFHPNASSYRSKTLKSIYRQHEQEKKRCYGQRVRDVERAAFTPLVFSSTGGMAMECTTFYKRLSSMIAEKRKMRYQHVITWLRCKISFILLKQSIMAIRCSRSARKPILIPADISD